MNIESILAKVKRGDPSAFAQVVTFYQRPLFAYLGRMGLSQAQAEEIAQETFLKAWQKIDDYDASRAQFSTWLFTIGRNLAINETAKLERNHEHVSEEALAYLPGEAMRPEDRIVQDQTKRTLQSALRALPSDDRSALALAYVHELDLASVARIEGCTTAAIKVRIHRAKQRLRQMLEKPS